MECVIHRVAKSQTRLSNFNFHINYIPGTVGHAGERVANKTVIAPGSQGRRRREKETLSGQGEPPSQGPFLEDRTDLTQDQKALADKRSQRDKRRGRRDDPADRSQGMSQETACWRK